MTVWLECTPLTYLAVNGTWLSSALGKATAVQKSDTPSQLHGTSWTAFSSSMVTT